MKVGLLSLRVVPQQQCNGHCPCDCPSAAVETAVAQCTSRWAMARGHRLNTSIVLAAVHGLSGLFRVVSAVEPSLSRPPPPPPTPHTPFPSPSLISHLASADVKKNVLSQHNATWWSYGKLEVQEAGLRAQYGPFIEPVNKACYGSQTESF